MSDAKIAAIAWAELRKVTMLSDDDLQECINGGSNHVEAIYNTIYEQVKKEFGDEPDRYVQ